MATTIRSNGLQHAISLGNIEISAKTNSIHTPTRCYDSEDENMGRRKTRPQTSGLYPKTSVYSKGDIREQYCLTDRQLSTIERPRRERFFGCWSGRGAPQSFLGVCVGRRAPSDENIADYAPFYKYPRYHPHDLLQYDEDLESSYFRRRPTSILSSGTTDAKRYTWMPADEEAIRLEGPRPICPEYDDFHRGPYVVGSYSPKQYLSQSTEQIAGLYRCPAHIGLPPPPPPPVVPMETTTPRTKHVSFARSHTLTSFDEAAMGLRSSIRLKSARSQERLIGGKKPILTTTTSERGTLLQPQQIPMVGPQMQQMLQTSAFHQHHHHHQQQQLLPAQHQPQIQQPSTLQHQPQTIIGPLQQQQKQHQQQQQQHQQTIAQHGVGSLLVIPQVQQSQPEVVVVEKIKRSTMKTQATQTEVYLGRKGVPPHHLSLSPRTIHRVKMVSQGAQTNGMLNGRKLIKSLSEMTAGQICENHKSDEPKTPADHEQLHRTFSEEPPRSPLMVPPPATHFQRYYEPSQSRASSRSTSEQPPSSLDHLSGHSRNHSQDSAISFRSTDVTCMTPSPSGVLSFIGPTSSVQSTAPATTTTATKTSQDSRLNFSYESMMSGPHSNISRPDSRQALDSHLGFDYESNSLPRRTCGHHRMEEYYTYSLPRREQFYQHEICRHVTECAELLNGATPTFHRETISRESSTDSSQMFEKRRASMGIEITPKTHATLRRQSMPSHANQIPQNISGGISSEENDEQNEENIEDQTEQQQTEPVEEEEEQEIFIDFKPHVSPTPSPRSRRKKLQKTLSDGEILFEKRQDVRDGVLIASASEEDLKPKDIPTTTIDYQYQNLPIKDEGICDKQNLLTLPTDADGSLWLKREAFRKRSISLEDPTAENEKSLTKSAPPSPCQEEISTNVQSAYPSSDSLANDLTRDHSDGIWNESQATVLPAEIREPEHVPLLLTPSSKRKHLLLQHQQRSSIDTEALDLEEQISEQFAPRVSSPILKPASTQTTILSPITLEPVITTTIPSILHTPSIAVTPSLSVDGDDLDVSFKIPSSSRRSSRTLSPALQERRKIEPLVHIHSPQRYPETSETITITPTLEQFPSRVEVIPQKNNTDISECSTNTDDYVTCTDNSKRTPGIKTPTTASSSSTQVPVSAQSSQTATQEGSSFESASSLYSTRGDGLSEEMPQIEEMTPRETDLHPPPPPTPTTTTVMAITKVSPSHSVSSSSSGSYNLIDLARSKAAVKTSPLRAIPGTKMTGVMPKKKSESISDDDRSEKRYSSSGYYESPQDEEHRSSKYRRTRDRLEEERRRRKNNMKLDIERENLRALTSPIKRPSPGFKQISPEDRSAMNVLDGASPSKAKRFRPKIRRQLRKSTTREESIPRKSKVTSTKSPERIIDHPVPPVTKISPSKFIKVQTSPKKQPTDSGNEKRLKAKSIESLRSASPGSDSVFYSEADILPDQQVHCLHCGKEVEIITAVSGSQDSIAAIENNGPPDIVKPPADFADSPVTTKTSQRLYKKMDKRFRSEERHAERRHYRNRQENTRAKSEERGKDLSSHSPPALRPAGSSPCVMPDETEKFIGHSTDLDQIIYRGNYRQGLYTRLTDSDVWIQLDHQSFDRHRDRRGSTDSEKTFHQKYQVILHRLVQRRCTLEMYQRQKLNSFKLLTSDSSSESLRRRLEEVLRLMLIVWAKEGQALKTVAGCTNDVDKTVIVKSDSGEFGFRIHGSKPVVVAAIEPDTPAESSGLEVGDIIISVNGIPVLDKHHTEVVKIAHAGCETLELEVARTIGVLMNEQQESASPALYTGYLWRQSGQAKGSPNSKKWVLRWFCLRPDHCLYYYKTDSDTQPVGALILTNHTVEHCSSDVGKPNAFRIDSGEGIPMYLAADTEEATNRWMAVLGHASSQADPWLEMTARNLRLPSNAIPRPDCFGYLMKLGSRWCGWSKRYCVLKDACLYFYQDVNSKNAFGMACLQGYKVVAMSSNAAGRKNAFEIVPPESKLRHYYFSAESEMDKKRWISALEYSIDRWIKAG